MRKTPGEVQRDHALTVLTDRAMELGATANDEAGIVRGLVLALGLGFNVWFCVCCDVADRAAQAQGFKSEVDRAYQAACVAVLGVGQWHYMRGDVLLVNTTPAGVRRSHAS